MIEKLKSRFQKLLPPKGWKLRFWWPPEWWRRVALVALYVCAPLMLLDFLFPPPLDRVKNLSAVVMDRRGAVLRIFPVEDGKWRMQAHLDKIDPGFIKALLAYEDKNFREHGGVDFLAMGRAAGSLVSAGHVVSGGSTITMQTARLLEPHPRNIGAKIIESIRAWQLEERYTKDQILELYLTLAPYGGNLEGIRAASWAYFGREPDNLSPDQIAMLIALPQSPEARRPDLHPGPAVIARKRVLMRLADENVFAKDLAVESSEYPAPKRRDFPTTAWHAAEEALKHSANHDNIATTIDLSLQKEIETLALRAAGSQRDHVQIAIMAVDIASRDIRAVAGSANRDVDGGWIDLTDRPRSPGSTLKPFIYGMAFDDGVASPDTRISDKPRRFADYRPDNFDRTFRGDVTVAQALQHSLNVPAVATLDVIGARRFVSALSFAGADLSLPLSADDDTGLAIALGGAGLTLRELTMLYAALGDDGRARPLNWLKAESRSASESKAIPTQIMSAASARQIVKILGEAPAPPGRMPAQLTQEAPVVAFKTGTSYGYRDAWAAGVSNGYAVVVWMGRADGAPRPGTTGREGALPVLFDAFDAIARITPSRPSGPPLRDADDPNHAPPSPLARFEASNEPPHILFPPDGAEVWKDEDHTSFVLAAEGHGRLSWYVDGKALDRDLSGEPVWRPVEPGFYNLAVVDPNGRTAKSRVRIKTPD
ncbi:MAG TPA: penicillin-binding protein 1C [Hyphomonadaceae bacterium]|nr:penicillin-binding protein 1C [Hyphomonadaceae bacterium]